MKLDVVCTGPVFLDLTFEGLEELPAPGQERFARELHQTPGGAGITAIGLSRLGLNAVVTPGPADDLAGRTLRGLLEDEGVLCVGPAVERTPVSVVLPLGGERAIISHGSPARIERGVLERLRPRANVIGLDQLGLMLGETAAYVVVDDDHAGRYAQALPNGLGQARALFANQDEAERLTGKPDPGDAALALAEHVETAVVTCGEDGAVAASGGEVIEAVAPRVEVRDTTGAGDLLVAAYVWGDLRGLPLDERLRRAVVYASLSVRTATGAGGAATLDELEDALADLGSIIVEQPSEQTASAKECA
jgi:ribokinase